MTKDILTQERLKQVLNYDPETGIFKRLDNLSNKCGCITKKNYLIIRVDRKPHMAHRLAWLYMYGHFPDNQVDHINGNRLDNRIKNLRDVCQTINQENQTRAHVNNGNGYLGVTKQYNKFIAQIRIKGERLYLGSFETALEAHNEYLRVKRLHHEGCMI